MYPARAHGDGRDPGNGKTWHDKPWGKTWHGNSIDRGATGRGDPAPNTRRHGDAGDGDDGADGAQRLRRGERRESGGAAARRR